MRRVIVVRKNTLTTLASSSSSSTSVTTTKVPRNPQCSKQQLALLPSTQSRPPSSGQPSDAQLAPFHLTLYPGKKRRSPRRLPRPYQLDTGAYGIPKHPSSSASNLAFLPHTKLSVQVGEDAYFTRPTSLGIADGVGGWSRRPCPSSSQPSPSALFSRRLMHFCSSLLSTNAHLHPSHILQQAYAHTLSAHSPLSTGSSTALLAVLDYNHSIVPLVHPSSLSENYAAGCIPSTSSPTTDTELPLLHIAHLGDSMAMLIRDSHIIWRTAEMWTSFNHPLQLAPGPSCPQPHTYSLPVHPNDIFILASDGLSDNLWDDDILDEVLKFTRGSQSHEPATPSPILSLLHSTPQIQILSEALCSRAKRVASSSSSTQSSTLISPPSNNPQSTSVAAATLSPTSTPTELGPGTLTDNLKDDTTPSTSTPFAHRAKLAGKPFRGGGKPDGAFLAGLFNPN